MSDSPGSMDLAPRAPMPLAGRLALLIVLSLTALGIWCIRTSESGDGWIGPTGFIQIVYAVAGIVLMLIVVSIGHAPMARLAYPLFMATLVVLVLLVVARKVPLHPVIPLKRNVARWVYFGPIGLQPSEFAKFTFVLALANYLKFRSNYRTLRGLIAPFVMTLIPLGLILVEPDLGTSLLLLPVLFVMLFAAGARKRHLALVMLLGVLAMPAFYFSPLMSDYQKQRLQVVVRQNDPDPHWQIGPGFQLRQAKIAIGSGGWTGQDADETAFFRHDLLPEDHNDFVFAIIGNQFGFFGAAALVCAYLALIVAGFVIASATDDPLARLLAVGVTAMIATQTVINIGMTIGLMPITGMTLPFISAGGSSLIANYLAVGLLLSVARHRPILLTRKPFEYDVPSSRE